MVEGIRVSAIAGDIVSYRLALRNVTEDLQRLIEFGEVLEQEDFPQVSSGSQVDVILNYSYIDRGVSN